MNPKESGSYKVSLTNGDPFVEGVYFKPDDKWFCDIGGVAKQVVPYAWYESRVCEQLVVREIKPDPVKPKTSEELFGIQMRVYTSRPDYDPSVVALLSNLNSRMKTKVIEGEDTCMTTLDVNLEYIPPTDGGYYAVPDDELNAINDNKLRVVTKEEEQVLKSFSHFGEILSGSIKKRSCIQDDELSEARDKVLKVMSQLRMYVPIDDVDIDCQAENGQV